MKLWSPLGRSVVAALVLCGGAHAEGDAAAGKIKAYTCMGCHGVASYKNVYPTYFVPKIAGQHPEYIVSALQAYRDGTRQHNTMKANATNLSDQDMADIAAWLSSDAAILAD
jgi:cytochrome c553